jgi:hypothetical protein
VLNVIANDTRQQLRAKYALLTIGLQSTLNITQTTVRTCFASRAESAIATALTDSSIVRFLQTILSGRATRRRGFLRCITLSAGRA